MKALLLIDLQRDYLDAAGLEPPKELLVERAAALLDAWRRAGRPVAHVLTTIRSPDERMPHWRRDDVRRVAVGTPGHAPPPPLRPHPGEVVLHKTGYSPFVDEAAVGRLAALNVEAVVLAGVHLHGCVRAVALDLYQRGWRVEIADDAVGGYDPLHGEVTRLYLDRRTATFRPIAALIDELQPSRVQTASPPTLPVAMIGGVDIGSGDAGGVVHHAPRDRTEALWRVPDASTADVARAVEAAARAQRSWAETPVEDRSAILRAAAERLHAEREDLARQLAVEIGKPVRAALGEVTFAVDLIDAAFRWAAQPGTVEGEGWHLRQQPRGVVAVVTPFNNPLAVPLGKVVPALLYGNGVVWKPAPWGSAVALRALRLLHACGCPPGLVNVALGHRRSAVALMAHPGVDAVTLTGSSLAGYTAQTITARRRVPLQAELGGNNAAVVLPDADLDAAAEAVAAGAFGSAGQRCTANRRVIVHADCEDAFLDQLEAHTARLVLGDPLDPDTRIGPVVSDAACARITAAVERARETGAEVRYPGVAPASEAFVRLAEAGSYLPPTIVHATEDATIVREETFGPVLVVQTARTFDEAVRLCDAVPQGLAASIFTASPEAAARFVDRVRCGIVKVNDTTAGVRADAPFGGTKASAVGPPEHGPFDRAFYTRPVTVYDGMRSGRT